MEEVFPVVVNLIVYFTVVIAGWALFKFGARWLDSIEKKIDMELDPKQLELVEKIVVLAVQAAEQIFGLEGDGEEKLEYVLGIIQKQFPMLDKDMIRAIIEAVVKDYKEFRKVIMEDE